jgi:hypothetical protein
MELSVKKTWFLVGVLEKWSIGKMEYRSIGDNGTEIRRSDVGKNKKGPARMVLLDELWGRTSYRHTPVAPIAVIRGMIAMDGYPTYDARHSKVSEREPS